MNNKKLKILKLTDKKSQCSNDYLSKLLSMIPVIKNGLHTNVKFIPNSSVLTYENAKNTCN